MKRDETEIIKALKNLIPTLIYNSDEEHRMVSEKDFQVMRVIPYLIENGHKIVGQQKNIGTREKLLQRADVISIKNDTMFITEVKTNNRLIVTNLQAAIGEIIIYKFLLKEEKRELKFQIIIPDNYYNETIKYDLVKFLLDRFDIILLFI